MICNPWLSINASNTVAECDKAYFIKNFGSVQFFENCINKLWPKAALTFNCLPEPYSGNHKSKVYCLNKNPGKPDINFFGNTDYENVVIQNLRLQAPQCLWSKRLKGNNGKPHIGSLWFESKTKELNNILGCPPNIFFIEYFPYHSTKGFIFPNDLPSYGFSDDLIYQAMKEGKLIIIMREKTQWLDRISGLENYSKLYTLKCPQGGHLTKNNIVHEKTKLPITDAEIKDFFI